MNSIKEFNDEVKRAIDGGISDIVGKNVVESLYKHLKEHYDIVPDEIPYRTDTLFETLEHTFGMAGARTLSRAIARRVYAQMGLPFIEPPDYRLQDYLEDAKKQLAKHPVQ
jgi:hypothetical protein